MIITLTPNPSIDRTIGVPDLQPGEVNRATTSRIDPGGKGVNVSRALSANGVQTVAVLPLGGPEGHLMSELLDAAGRLLLNGSLTDPSTYVPLPGIGEGIYLLRITNAERVESIRFLHR